MQPGWWELPAVKQQQVFIVDHAVFSRPGPRLVDGVELLARLLHPNLIQSACPEGTVLNLQLPTSGCCKQLLPSHFVAFQ